MQGSTIGWLRAIALVPFGLLLGCPALGQQPANNSAGNISSFAPNPGTPAALQPSTLNGRMQDPLPAQGAFSRGLGQIVSGWTHQGIVGRPLAERIHELQQERQQNHRPGQNSNL